MKQKLDIKHLSVWNKPVRILNTSHTWYTLNCLLVNYFRNFSSQELWTHFFFFLGEKRVKSNETLEYCNTKWDEKR